MDAEQQEELNDTNPLLFPSRPHAVPAVFEGDPLVDTEAWNAWRKDKFLMDAWENSWAWYGDKMICFSLIGINNANKMGTSQE